MAFEMRLTNGNLRRTVLGAMMIVAGSGGLGAFVSSTQKETASAGPQLGAASISLGTAGGQADEQAHVDCSYVGSISGEPCTHVTWPVCYVKPGYFNCYGKFTYAEFWTESYYIKIAASGRILVNQYSQPALPEPIDSVP